MDIKDIVSLPLFYPRSLSTVWKDKKKKNTLFYSGHAIRILLDPDKTNF